MVRRPSTHTLSLLIEAAYRCIQSQNNKLKECGFIFVGTLAKVYGRDFSVFVGKLATEIYNCLEQEEFANLDDYDENEDIGIDEEKDMYEHLNVGSAIALEKEYATDARRSYRGHSGGLP